MSEKPLACPNLSWKMKLIIFVMNFVNKFTCRSDGTVNRRLLSFLDYKVPPSIKPINGIKTSDIIVDVSRNLWFRLFVPSNDADMPVIVYFHGGGFTTMYADSSNYDSLCRRFAAELNAVIISVNYRLAPEHKYPCQYEDGFDVLKFIENNPNFEGFPTNANMKNCFIGGDSAGGNIAHHVAVKACNYEFRNLKFTGVIAIQPGFSGKERTESEMKIVGAPFLNVEAADFFWKAFLPEDSDRDHPALNVFGPKSEDISELNFPAAIVIVGGFDPLKDWQKRYYEGLKKCGKEAYLIEYPNAFHGFISFPEQPECSLFINEVREFIQRQSDRASTHTTWNKSTMN
ncbi:Alpha/beta hydrolase-3 [Melia azedarach]|uniref:Alpha/beta hydrolase-3 n=2 Tax=Melia azedarach TaxID=155640 RepID=A0ACC1XSF8_MELAZ|nr:Alpha/beta hydrolase-3 [Melia azedarach]KAJ4713882.1 Alpha/beta hydrolase-3 [Melia azedarach]